MPPCVYVAGSHWKDAVSVCWLVLSYNQMWFISKMHRKGLQIASVDICMFLNRINSCAARGNLSRHALFTQPPPTETVAERSKINKGLCSPTPELHASPGFWPSSGCSLHICDWLETWQSVLKHFWGSWGKFNQVHSLRWTNANAFFFSCSGLCDMGLNIYF